jgi:hypothetical protein
MKKFIPLSVAANIIFSAQLNAQESNPKFLPEITVTGTREARKISETPVSVGVIKQETLHLTRPTHPQEI